MDSRKNMGKYKDEVIFPIVPQLFEMDDEYIWRNWKKFKDDWFVQRALHYLSILIQNIKAYKIFKKYQVGFYNFL